MSDWTFFKNFDKYNLVHVWFMSGATIKLIVVWAWNQDGNVKIICLNFGLASLLKPVPVNSSPFSGSYQIPPLHLNKYPYS